MGRSDNRFRFTKQALIDLKPTDKTYQVSDTMSRGLILLVTAAGSKTFYRYGRIDGRVRRVKIGPFPELSVPRARQLCDAINGNLAEGKSPGAPQRGGLTFGDLWQHYWDEHATVKKAESSRKHDEWQWEKFIKPRWQKRKATGLKKPDVLDLQTQIAKKHGRVSANRAISLVKKIFNHAIDADRIEANPAATVRKYPEESRERFLQGEELPRFFQALVDFDNPDLADFWWICLYTGARQSNVLEMRWRDIDMKDCVWTIPKTKGGKPLRIPVVEQAVEILERRANLSEWVFPSHSKSGHITRPGKAWERLLAQAGIENLTMHDLRRSLGSYQAAAGVSELIIGKSLGHAPGSRATSIYARLNLDSVRQAVAAAAAAMESAAKPQADSSDEPK